MLLVILAGTFMSTLDFFIVNVAIPSMQRDLHAGTASIQLVIACYALGYGIFLITGGRLGDILGRRRMYMVGMALFTLASAACGLAGTAGFLIVARALQGVAAAMMGPQVLALISTAFGGSERQRAVGAYGVTMGIAAVFGQLVGGLFIRLNLFGLDWRTCFLVNLPVGLLALTLIPRMVGESRAASRPGMDFGGTALVTAALLAVVLPLIEGRQQGWPEWSWLSLAASVPLFAIFVLYESRRSRAGRSPLVDMTLFRQRAFSAGLLSQLVFWTGQASYFLILAVYLQNGRGLNALGAGMVFAAVGAGYMVTSTTVGRFARRFGRNVIALGAALRTAGLAVLIAAVHISGTSGSIVWIIPALALDGAGMGLAIAPLASTVLSRITHQHAGAASGVLTTAIQVGNAVGVALIGIVFYAALTNGTGAVAFTQAFTSGLIFLIGVGIVLAVTVQFLPQKTAEGVPTV
jgi:EmrB/QacA subfamily drug resistance transporter